MRQPHRLSTASYQTPQRCFVTFATRHRQPVLTEPAVADLVVEALMSATLSGAVELTGYCLMPDHLHGLLTVEADPANPGPSNIRRTIEAAKQRSGFAYARWRRTPLWQASCFDRTLRSDDRTATVVAYILGNPVRAGFVSSPDAWPFIGSSCWSREELLEFVSTERGRAYGARGL